ncbi:hypothetical protein B7P43_G12304 [Cryptotermes secundus]|uniref:DUF4817 domain-containing protein n=1 Tax=Cryptotermes secundus TaxID=105785 RepID=A0A2J7RMF7_9NEOP|nr:hypothetical protein B7P43_G12304 [Cryptotermes secundus]
MAWHSEHRAFVVEEYIRNGESVITTQRAFRIRFELGRHDPVPDRKTIHVWVSNFRATGSALKKKSPGRPRTVTTPENVARVRASIQQSPKHSALKHAAALGLSDRSVRRILHRNLHMHPYKMMVTQELSERDAQVYKHRPTTLQALKEAITQAVAAIPLEMTRRTMDNFRERLLQCVNNGGRHLPEIIFKTK